MLPTLDHYPTRFTTPARRTELLTGCSEFTTRKLGESEEGRDVIGVRLGQGPLRATIIAGSHADEPVGPETLLALLMDVERRPDAWSELLGAWSLTVIPQVNPDGEARNQSWIRRWPDLAGYLMHAVRELPGRDIEFGYPDLRPENRVVARAMRYAAPLNLHMSLHGMGFSDGAMLLIDRYWGWRAAVLRDGFRAASASQGLRMHDHNRMGEKGFFQIEPGYTTTPEGAAMRTYFESRGEPETAARFRDSSMEYARSLGGDPLCVVTELPLFLVGGSFRAGVPEAYLEFNRQKPELRARLAAGEAAEDVLGSLSVAALPLSTAVRLQWEAMRLAVMTASGKPA
ncbi:MAG: hypothetical protein JJ896_16795 [Rhodothermales bacterium]|nr:hypothetical protein [Rhodothermales bacterium]MBO6781317.1 hypothetical protein [Rhodothermales bacterium]